jgi:hypothetical protein
VSPDMVSGPHHQVSAHWIKPKWPLIAEGQMIKEFS